MANTNNKGANRQSPAQTNRRTADVPVKKQPAKRKRKKSSDAKAKTFLFITLIAIAVLVAFVCIKMSDSNSENGDDVSSAQNSETVNSNDVPANATVNGSDGTGDSSSDSPHSSEDEETTDDTSDGEPSFNNPETVTDCSFDTVVVNRNYRIPESYEDTLDLVYVCGSNQRLQKDVAVQYEAMYNAALEDGLYLTPCSGYRSYETQTELYNNKVNVFLNQGYSEDEARVQAATIVMVPGSSEHNLGYAMDIVCVEEWFENTDEFAWLMENAEDYGFILRYPEDKQDITKVIYEPWHWRYVGVEAAKAINASGLTLEEYYGKSAQ